MAGYHNFSMSNNAVAAYMCGEKPRSKWTKSAIIAVLKEAGIDDEKIAIIRTASAKASKKLLRASSWHHTSSYYNCTDFYTVDTDMVESMTAADLADLLQDEPKEEPSERKAVCTFLVWSGTRKHPKATECTDTGVIKGNWFYLQDGSKKSINANGFHIVNYL